MHLLLEKNQWKHNTLYVIIEAMMVIYKRCLSTDLAYAVECDDIVSHCSNMCIKCCIVFCILFYGMSAVQGVAQ